MQIITTVTVNQVLTEKSREKLFNSFQSRKLELQKEIDQLATAETWLKQYPDHPELFLSLGRLSLRQKFIGKAQNYLNESIRLEPTAAAYQELGKTYETQGQKDSALIYYHKAFALQAGIVAW